MANGDIVENQLQLILDTVLEWGRTIRELHGGNTCIGSVEPILVVPQGLNACQDVLVGIVTLRSQHPIVRKNSSGWILVYLQEWGNTEERIVHHCGVFKILRMLILVVV